MIVIALTGLAGAGKDAVADVLVRDHGFTRMAFATPLKSMLQDLDPIVGYYEPECDCGDCDCCPIEDVHLSTLYDDFGLTNEDIKHTIYGPEVRRLWENFGTDVMRKRWPDFWVEQTRKEILNSGFDRVVISDCRFPNEADMVYSLSDPVWDDRGDRFEESPYNSSVWNIVRPDLERGEHEAESHSGMLAEELTLHNDGSLEGLAENVEIALGFVTTGEVKTMAAFSWLKAFNAGRWRKQ